MTTSKSILLAAALSASLPAVAQQLSGAQATDMPRRQLSLTEAIELSIKNSNQLHVNTAQLAQANAAYREAKNNRLPDATVSGSYLRLTQPTIDLKVKLNSSTDTGHTSTTQTDVSQAAYVIANVSMPIFAGFRIQAGIESAKYLAKAAELDAAGNRDEVVQNTISAYSNLYKAYEAVQLVTENLQNERQRVRDFTNLETNGIIARNDLLKAELQQSNISLSLLDAQSNLKIATINMNLMLGLPEETPLTVDTNTFVTLTADAKTMADWEQTALQSRSDAGALKFRELAAGANIKATKSEYYPSLAVTGGYVAADIPNFLTITNAVNIGVGVRYSASSLWKTKAKVAQAEARVQEIQANEEQLRDGIRLQIAQAYQNFILSKQKIDVYNQAIDQATENYRITHNKYTNSLATTTDLLDADVAQLQAKLNYAYAKADATVAYKKLLQTAGVLYSDNTVSGK